MVLFRKSHLRNDSAVGIHVEPRGVIETPLFVIPDMTLNTCRGS